MSTDNPAIGPAEDPAEDALDGAPDGTTRPAPSPDLASTVVTDPQGASGSRRGRLVAPLAAAAAVTVAVAGVSVGVLVTRGDDKAVGGPPVLHLVGAAEGAGSDTPVGTDARAPVSNADPALGITIKGPLPTRPDRAAVWTLPDRLPARDTVAVLAHALGVTGEPRRTSAGWQVGQVGQNEQGGTGGQSGRVLVVYAAPGQPWRLGGQAPLAPVTAAPRPGPGPTMDCHVIIEGRRGCGQVEPGAGSGVGSGDRLPEQPGIVVRGGVKEPDRAVPGSGGSSGSAGVSGDTATSSGAEPAGPGVDSSAADSGSAPALPPIPGVATSTATRITARPQQPGQAPGTVEPVPSEAEVRGAAGPLLDALGLTGARISVQTGPGRGSVSADPVVDGPPVEGLTTRLEFDPKMRLDSGGGWLGTPTAGDEYPIVDAKAALERTLPRTHTCDPCVPPAPGRVRGDGVVTGARLGLQLHAADGTKLLLVPTWIYDLHYGTTKVPLTRIAVDPRYLAPPSDSRGLAEPAPADPVNKATRVAPAPSLNTPGAGDGPTSGDAVEPAPPAITSQPGPTGGMRPPVEPPATR